MIDTRHFDDRLPENPRTRFAGERSDSRGLLTILTQSNFVRSMILAVSLLSASCLPSGCSPKDHSSPCEQSDSASQQAMEKLSQILVQYHRLITVGNWLMKEHQSDFSRATQFSNPVEISQLQRMMEKRKALALAFSRMVDRVEKIISQDCVSSQMLQTLYDVLAKKLQENWPQVLSLDEQINNLFITIAQRALLSPCNSGADTTCL